MWKPKIAHLFNILGQLSPYSQVTVASLAKEYNVSEETIKKNIDTIMTAGLGVFYDEKKIRISKYGYRRIRSWILNDYIL